MILEKDINNRIASKFRREKFFVVQEARFNPAEIDIIIFDIKTLKTACYEIKRSNWKEALRQACRNKRYCHYSYAILPEKRVGNIPRRSFEENGIGLIIFKVLKRGIKLLLIIHPKLSDSINRVWKRAVYSKFSNKITLVR